MRINEVDDSANGLASAKLLGLAQFIQGRNKDQNAQSKISSRAFIEMAQSLGININEANLSEYVGQPPLSEVFQPFDQSTGYLLFRGPNNELAGNMPVNQAQDIVAQAAKRQIKSK
jgi:hypothetical protein